MDNDQQQQTFKDLQNNRKIGTLAGMVCLIVFFVLLTHKSRISGYQVLSFPIILAVGAFFGGMGLTGKIKDGLKYLGLLSVVLFIIILVGLLLRK